MAHDSPEKKRKRASDKHDRPSKKAAIAPVAPLKVEFVHNPDGPAPAIASTPGVNLSESVPLDAFTKPRGKRSKSAIENADIASSELLLHSSAHPKLDFTGNEGEDELDNHWNHYVAIYDPDAGTLQVAEARKMTVRARIREVIPESEEESDEEVTATPSAWSQRTALAEAFGTKQARKAVQSVQENALLASASTGAPNAAESALLSSIPTDLSGSQQKSAQEEIQAAKPLPQPNLSANHPSQAYSIESLVPGGMSTLRQMPIRDWEQALASSSPITTSSRFVSNRVETVGGDKTKLQILRLILMLLEFSKSLKPSRGGPDSKAGPGSKKLPPRDELRKILSSTTGAQGAQSITTPSVSDSLLDTLRRKFAPQGSFLARTDITFLHTTICALSLHIPPEAGNGPNELATDPADLRDDLRIDNQVVMQYFRELGCRIDKPRESEYVKWGIKTKVEASAKRIVRLRLPLEFPKLSRGSGARRR
ncbi:hypothetical protein VTO42DRAFT_7518 [Malbranchea cinnamomea]